MEADRARGVEQVAAAINPILAPWIIFANFLQKIYLQRGLIRSFVVRDLRARYVGSFMGFFWSIVHPIVLIVSYTFVFQYVFKIRPLPDTGTTSFPVFLFCGILPWLFFQDCVQRSSTVIVDNTNLVTKTLFPTEILPLTVLLAGIVNHLIGIGILIVMLLFTLHEVGPLVLMVPFYLLCLSLFTLGVSWMVSSFNVFVRDVSQVLGVLLIFWFWFTPIFYVPDMAPAPLQTALAWNPMSHIVAAYRDCLLKMEMPDLQLLAILFASSFGVFVIGGVLFRMTKRGFADVL